MFSLFVLFILAATISASPVARANTRQYTITNLCPKSINVYTVVDGVISNTIEQNGSLVKTLGTGSEASFYTDANNGGPKAKRNIQAVFSTNFYYLVADPDYVNAPVRVVPTDSSPNNGFCPSIECDGVGCTQAFSQAPTSFPSPSTTSPPSSPLYRCPDAAHYGITFCPGGSFTS